MRNLFSFLAVASCLTLASCAAPPRSYRTSVGEGPDQISVVVVSGTPYKMGQAFGRLMKDEVKPCMTGWLAVAQREDPDRCSNAALDAAWGTVAPHTNDRFKQELAGMADGSGVPIEVLRRVHMIPVVSDFACSGVAVWGPATASGHLLQLRNLDFSTNAGLQDYPVIVVYLPDKGIPHVNPTFAGFVGSHTGMNTEGVVLGEKGESPKSDFPFNLDGVHFTTLFRDLLYRARDLDQALGMIQSARRIKRYYWYLGDGKGPDVRAVKIKVTTPDPIPLTIWRDNDKTDELAPKVLKNAIYNTMENEIAYKHLKANWGRYDPDKMIALSRQVASKNGNLVNVVYDATALELWVAHAEESEYASKRPYVHLKMRDYLDPSRTPPGAVVWVGK